MTDIKAFFEENGYYLAKGVFSPDEVQALEEDFDRIVAQLQSSGEAINARWGGDEMKRLDGGDSVIVHTHNMQCFSERWLRACQHPRFLDGKKDVVLMVPIAPVFLVVPSAKV